MGSTYAIYGTQTAFGNVSNLNSLATVNSCGLGSITTGNYWGYLIDCTIVTGGSAGTSGYIQWYLVQAPSVSGSAGTYTDNLSAGAAGASGVNFYNSLAVHRTSTPANSTTFYDRWLIPSSLIVFPYWTLFAYNGTAGSLGSSGHAVNYTAWYGND